MANENEKNPSALEELRRLKRTDRIKSLDIHEPELRDFNAENIFHIDEEPEKKTIFGKRSAKTHVKINENIFDDEIAESVDITPSTSIEEVEAPIEKRVVEEPKVVVDEPVIEEEPKVVDEPVIEEEPKVVVEEPKKIVVENLDVDDEPKKIVVEKLDVDDDFTTESIENELKAFNEKPIEEEQPIQEVLDDEEDYEDEYEDDDEDDEDQTLHGIDQQQQEGAGDGPEERTEDGDDVRDADDDADEQGVRHLEDGQTHAADDADDEGVEQLAGDEAEEDAVDLPHVLEDGIAGAAAAHGGVEDLLGLAGELVAAEQEVDHDDDADDEVQQVHRGRDQAVGHVLDHGERIVLEPALNGLGDARGEVLDDGVGLPVGHEPVGQPLGGGLGHLRQALDQRGDVEHELRDDEVGEQEEQHQQGRRRDGGGEGARELRLDGAVEQVLLREPRERIEQVGHDAAEEDGPQGGDHSAERCPDVVEVQHGAADEEDDDDAQQDQAGVGEDLLEWQLHERAPFIWDGGGPSKITIVYQIGPALAREKGYPTRIWINLGESGGRERVRKPTIPGGSGRIREPNGEERACPVRGGYDTIANIRKVSMETSEGGKSFELSHALADAAHLLRGDRGRHGRAHLDLVLCGEPGGADRGVAGRAAGDPDRAVRGGLGHRDGTGPADGQATHAPRSRPHQCRPHHRTGGRRRRGDRRPGRHRSDQGRRRHLDRTDRRWRGTPRRLPRLRRADRGRESDRLGTKKGKVTKLCRSSCPPLGSPSSS